MPRALLGGLCRRFPGGLVLRSVGRQYPGEARPRWNLGLYRRRDGAALWHGPPDPILAAPGSETQPELEPLGRGLVGSARGAGVSAFRR